MKIAIPQFCLVVLVGPAGCGKTTFAHKHFRKTEILSSDFCRVLVSDNEDYQLVTRDAFEVLHLIARKRIANGRLTVIDATNVESSARRPLLELARAYDCPAIGIVFNVPEQVCQERDALRTGRSVGPQVIGRQIGQLQLDAASLSQEGFLEVYWLTTEQQIDDTAVERRGPS